MGRSRVRALAGCALVAVCATALAGCSGGGDDGDAARSSSTTTVVPVGDPACRPFPGSTTSLESVADVGTAVRLLKGATAGAVGCVDRVAFEFDSADGTAPGYEVRYQDIVAEPLPDGGAGLDDLAEAFLVVRMQPAASVDRTEPEREVQTYRGNTTLAYGDHNHLMVVRKLSDVDGSVVWVIGLDAVRPFTVDASSNPAQVAVYIG